MQAHRAAVREAVARERSDQCSQTANAAVSTSHDLPSRDLPNVSAADALMGVMGLTRASIPNEQRSKLDCTQTENVRTQTGNNEQRFPDQEKSPDREKLILVVPDIHAPQQDEKAYGALLAMMREHRFREVVLLGDAIECVSCSWYGGPAALQSYKDECAKARAVLKRLLALHSGPVTLTVGNHDSRPDQKVEKTAPQLHGSIVDEMRWNELGVTVVAEDAQPITRGHLRLLHGHQDSGKFPAMYHARKMADLYGLPGGSVIYGHTHKDQTHSRPMHGGPARAYGLGCLERRPRWLKGADSWTASVAVADPDTGCVNVLPIVNGALFYGGVRYAG